MADTTIWLKVPLTEMENTTENEYLSVYVWGDISVLDVLNLKCK